MTGSIIVLFGNFLPKLLVRAPISQQYLKSKKILSQHIIGRSQSLFNSQYVRLNIKLMSTLFSLRVDIIVFLGGRFTRIAKQNVNKFIIRKTINFFSAKKIQSRRHV